MTQSRRRFLKITAGAIVTPLISHRQVEATPQLKPEMSVLVWAPHSIIGAQNRGVRIDKDLIRSWIRHCGDHGVTSIFWRGSYVGAATYHSKVLPVLEYAERARYDRGDEFGGKVRESLPGWKLSLKEFNGIAQAIKAFDVLDVARNEAGKRNLPFYADLAPFDKYFPGLEERYYEAHPDLWLWSRSQKTRYRGIPCYAEPGAREHLLAEARELLQRGVDGISLGLLSHMGDGPAKGEASYGFNPPVVALFKKRWGIDILKEDFDSSKLSELNGEMFTGMLKDLRQMLGSRKKLIAPIVLGEGNAAKRWGSDETGKFVIFGGSYRINLEWPRWIEEGIADDLLVMPLASSNAVSKVQNGIKRHLGKGRVFLMRKLREREMLTTLQSELEAVRAGGLDGYVLSEHRDFEPAHTSWCELLSKD